MSNRWWKTEPKEYTIISPLKVHLGYTREGKDKWFALNLNQYRNAHHFVLSKSKVVYSEEMFSQIAKLPSFNEIELEYSIYLGSNQKSDIMNWVSVIDKYFQDCLVQQKKLVDDNYQYVSKVTARVAGVDKQNPRAVITIKPL